MVTSVKRGFFLSLGLLMLLILSSCGSAGTQQSTSTGAAQPTSAPAARATTDTSDGYGKGYGKGGTTSNPTATPATNTASITVKTSSATVNGKSVTILVSANGMTLYYFTPDTTSKTVCTDGCASTWPPVLFSTGNKPQAAGSLPGSLEVYPNANGKQVVYNDHPLYTFSGDSAPGQTNGEGIAGKWFVVTPDLAKNQG